uniref:Uncharacterized protein n=1 Tax=Cucumis melo TaxID=3656 RepID=A0A9I9EI84_CUCME
MYEVVISDAWPKNVPDGRLCDAYEVVIRQEEHLPRRLIELVVDVASRRQRLEQIDRKWDDKLVANWKWKRRWKRVISCGDGEN